MFCHMLACQLQQACLLTGPLKQGLACRQSSAAAQAQPSQLDTSSPPSGQLPVSSGELRRADDPSLQQDPQASPAATAAQDASSPQEARPGASREGQASVRDEADAAADLKVSVRQEERENDRGPEQPLTPQQHQPLRDKGKSTEPDPHMTALIGETPMCHGYNLCTVLCG